MQRKFSMPHTCILHFVTNFLWRFQKFHHFFFNISKTLWACPKSFYWDSGDFQAEDFKILYIFTVNILFFFWRIIFNNINKSKKLIFIFIKLRKMLSKFKKLVIMLQCFTTKLETWCTILMKRLMKITRLNVKKSPNWKFSEQKKSARRIKLGWTEKVTKKAIKYHSLKANNH